LKRLLDYFDTFYKYKKFVTLGPCRKRMKRHGIAIFIISVLILVVACWYFFPAGGVKVGPVKLRFPSYESSLKELREGRGGVNVDSVLLAAKRSYELMQESSDTLSYFKEYLDSNPARIFLPDSGYTYFDSLFTEMEKASSEGRVVRIMHYGDSQLEMDRISSVLRQELQERFGGSGPGMVPMIKSIASVSVIQWAGGNAVRYARVVDSLSRWSWTRRYGPMAQYVGVYGSGRFNFKKAQSRYARERAGRISRISVLLGHNSPGLSLTLKCDTLAARTEVLDSALDAVSLVSWNLPVDVASGSVTFDGDAEVYGIMLDGEPGVTVDNVALRGCTGNIFTGIDSTLMSQSFERTDTRLIILQFGGNAMPGIGSRKSISLYVNQIDEQIDYFREVAPGATLLFVGPADMCKSYDGWVSTWPLLPDLNDSLKVHCLSKGVAYWDTFNMMGGAGSMRQWVNHNPPLGGPDYIHFTSKGADEIGSSLAKALLVYYDLLRLRRKLPEDGVNEYMDR
jgi:lysophospholipase L1-like esterase